jgi:hypothetical protein
MRTTVTLDADVAKKLKDLQRLRKTSFKATLNDVLRSGLRRPATDEAEPFTVEPHRGGFLPGIDPYKLNQLSDDLEAADFAEDVTR